MVILWVLSCLVLLSGAFECGAPAVNLTRANNNCICDVIFKNSDLIHICDANVFRPSMQNIDANCTIFNVPRNASKAELTKTYEKICKTLKVELCGSQTDAKYNLFQVGTLKGRDTPDCSPSKYKNFNVEECVTSEWRCTYPSNKWVPDNHLSLQLRNNKECRPYWLNKFEKPSLCFFFPKFHSCEDVSGSLLVCERNRNCELAGFVEWGSYLNTKYGQSIVTRIYKSRYFEIFLDY